MGEIADMMIDGTMCQFCGEWMDEGRDGPGYPQSCGCDGASHSQGPGDGSGKRRRAKRKRQRKALARREQLAAADTTGWTQLNPHHFRHQTESGLIDWWPSTDRYAIDKIMQPGTFSEFKTKITK